jgi:chromosome segregation ATPase
VLQSLQKQVVALNATIHVHYRQLIADSSYLKKLETIKPTFLKSLDDVSKQINGLRSTVMTNLVKDNYKNDMVRLLSRIHFRTHNITGYVATAFMAHYNKYKQLLQSDNSGYDADLKKLNKLVETYRIQAQKVADVTAEYNKILSIVAKVKATYDTSVAENADLDDLVKRVLKLLTTKSCVA